MDDFLVVGGGIAGASIAAELATSGTVRLIEMEGAGGYHSTGRSAAIFSVTYGNETIRALTRASESFFISPPPDFTESALAKPLGRLVVGATQTDAAIAGLLRDPAVGPRVKLLTGREVTQLVPILREDVAAVGVLDLTALDIDVSSLLHGYFRLARRRGAKITFNCQLRSAEWTGNHWCIDTTAERLDARVLVNAAGAWADKLAAAARVAPLPLTPLRRTAILVDTASGTTIKDWPQVVSPGTGIYFKPDSGRLLVSPMDETCADPCDVQPDDFDVAVCVERLETTTHLSVRRVSHKWAGLRTFAPDRSPVVGYDPTAHSFFWVAGQGGYGIQTAPALSKLAASIATNHSPAAPPVDRELAAAVSVERLRQSSGPWI